MAIKWLMWFYGSTNPVQHHLLRCSK